MDIISSVSGGSITAAHLALQWENLQKNKDNFREIIADPLIEFTTTKTIDTPAIFVGTLSPFSTIGDQVAKSYDELFHHQTLQQFPEPAKAGNPVFSILATNLKNGLQVKFRRNCFFHYPIGYLPAPNIPVSVAVSASSAFPPVLSPVTLKLAPDTDFFQRPKRATSMLM